jgi:membrane-bound serine protease (ClpP class)
MTILWLVILGMAGLAFPAGAGERSVSSSPSAATAPAAVVSLRDQINAYTEKAFKRHVEQARQEGAKVIVVDLNTNGGTVDSSMEISRFIKGLTDVRTVAYVNTKAYSGGAMVALACNEIVMAPGAVYGDCEPIAIDETTGTLQPLPAAERAKHESPILSEFEDSADRNGYDPTLITAMVTLGRAVHWIEKDGQRRFVDEQQYQKLKGEGWKAVADLPDPVNASDRLLTVYTDKALKLGLAKGQADSIQQLAQQRHLNILATYTEGPGEKIIAFLNRDMVRMVLLVIFLTAMYAAFHAPGHGFAEVIAVAALAVLLAVPMLTGYAQWWEIIAILVGIGLLALEIFVIPGFGITGLTGIALVLVGLTLTFVAPEPGRSPLSLPTLPTTWISLQQGLLVVIGGLTSSLLLCWWLRQYLPKVPYFNRLILTTTVGTESAMVGSLSNIDPADLTPGIGTTGVAATDLRPGGSAQFRDAAGGAHLVSVVNDSGFVPKGTTLVVREVGMGRVLVRPVEKPAKTERA